MTGPITSAEEGAKLNKPPPIPVRKRFYHTECERCGWVGSSEQCFSDGDSIGCPACYGDMAGNAPKDRDVAEHGERVMQRILTADSEVSRLTERLAKVEAENARLKKRLEIDHAFDTAGNRIPFPEGMERWDGIACRDETIKGIEEVASALAERVASLEAALKPFAAWIDSLDVEFADHGDDIVAGGLKEAFVTFGDLRAARAALKESSDA